MIVFVILLILCFVAEHLHFGISIWKKKKHNPDNKVSKGEKAGIICMAVFDAVIISFFVFLFCEFEAEWYIQTSYCLIGIICEILIVGFIAGWWNWKRFFIWCICAILACGSLWAGYRYSGYLKGITLHEYFDYSTYTPFTTDSLVKTLNEEPYFRFTDKDIVPKMDGATALYPVYAAFAQAVYPDSIASMHPWEIREIISCSTTGRAYRRIVDKECDIIFVAGPSKEQEAYAAEKGVELVYTPIGREAFVFFVHPDNPVKDMSLSQIRSVYSGEITRWDQLGVNGLGNILAYQRSEGSGSQTTLERFVMQGTPLMPAAKENVVGDMGGIIEQVSEYKNHRNAIGYSFRFYCTALMKNFHVNLLAVNGIAPTVENIENGTYPLASSFYAVTRSDADENTLALLNWICGPQGQALVEETGYTPIANGAEEKQP